MKRRSYFVSLLALVLIAGSANFAFGGNELRVKNSRGHYATSFVQDEILVQFTNSDHAVRVRVPRAGTEAVMEALERFNERSDVLYAEPNYIAHALYVPNDTYYDFQWHFDNDTYGGIGMEEAWDVTKGAGAVIAVVDTGVAYETYTENHRNRFYQAPDLAGTSFVAGYDFVNNDSHPNDDEGHGTHVAGTIAQSTGNGLGVAGIAPDASIMPVKVLNAQGSGSYADIADGIVWATDHGADVINLSLGGPSGSNTLRNALQYAYDHGVTVVAAAGNDGHNGVSYPAAYDEYVIAVGATRFDETRATYSNYGSSLDIMAPGGDTSVDQNGDGYVDGVLQQTFGNRTDDFGYYFYQGTSMASPHVAGVAALVIANGTATTPDDVRSALEDTADTVGDATHYGHGLVNAYAALQWNGGAPDPDPDPTPNAAPTANAGPDRTVDVGESINFSGFESSDSDGTIVDYAWDFGDGSEGSGISALHSYGAAGEYTVTLTVTDDDGATESDTATVLVNEVVVGDMMHVDSIDMDGRNHRRRGCTASADVTLLDESDLPISSATVNGHWSGAYASTVSSVTNTSGMVSFSVPGWQDCGTFTFTIDSVTHSTLSLDVGASEMSDSITL